MNHPSTSDRECLPEHLRFRERYSDIISRRRHQAAQMIQKSSSKVLVWNQACVAAWHQRIEQEAEGANEPELVPRYPSCSPLFPLILLSTSFSLETQLFSYSRTQHVHPVFVRNIPQRLDDAPQVIDPEKSRIAAGFDIQHHIQQNLFEAMASLWHGTSR